MLKTSWLSGASRQSLAALRDALLPKLVSGELAVKYGHVREGPWNRRALTLLRGRCT